jgi:CheY-like chemotaxis protein
MAGETILIIEDNPVNMELAAVILEMKGFRILQAESAEVGIATAKSESPHLVLMDINLPGMDGLDATRTLKGDPDTAKIPVVALTALAMKGDKERILAAGCDGYITKPIDTREFAGTVAGYLASKFE